MAHFEVEKAPPFFTLVNSAALKCHNDLTFNFHGRIRVIDSYYLCINDAPGDSDEEGTSGALLVLGGGQQPSSTLVASANSSSSSSSSSNNNNNNSAPSSSSSSLPPCYTSASSVILTLLRQWQVSVSNVSLDGKPVYLPFEVSDEHVGCLRVSPGGINLKVTVGTVDVPGCDLQLGASGTQSLESEFVNRNFGGGDDDDEGNDEINFEPMDDSMLNGQEATCWVTRNEFMDGIDASIAFVEQAMMI